MKFKEYIYRYTYNILFYSDSGFGESVANPWGIVGDPWGIRGGSVGDPWQIVGDPWGIRGGSVGDPWGIRGGSWQIRGGFGRFFKIPFVLRYFLAFGGVFWTSLRWAFALTSSWSKLASGGCPSQGQN